ncbi:hypothetical protein BCM14_2593 [Jezberella montanilacus]|uniref:Uncharacterized protein n=1 Tax=Jezberella montanilacus TaxID=323426 RepID=A0A2T0XD61_9BURK|nr:hypothetical protein [Jezberella montanilacus]PRY96837.1 hypothetical protein BCM14_2593 [Jezberella montanilacus]
MKSHLPYTTPDKTVDISAQPSSVEKDEPLDYAREFWWSPMHDARDSLNIREYSFLDIYVMSGFGC